MIEIHALEASQPSDYTMRIKNVKGGQQVLNIEIQMSEEFLKPDTFAVRIGQMINNSPADASAICAARKDCIRNQKKINNHKMDVQKKFITLTQQIKLPFPCDDVFDKDAHQTNYPNTGFDFVSWMTTDEDGHDVCMTSIYVILVGKDKIKAEQQKLGTPQKRKMIGPGRGEQIGGP